MLRSLTPGIQEQHAILSRLSRHAFSNEVLRALLVRPLPETIQVILLVVRKGCLRNRLHAAHHFVWNYEITAHFVACCVYRLVGTDSDLAEGPGWRHVLEVSRSAVFGCAGHVGHRTRGAIRSSGLFLEDLPVAAFGISLEGLPFGALHLIVPVWAFLLVCTTLSYGSPHAGSLSVPGSLLIGNGIKLGKKGSGACLRARLGSKRQAEPVVMSDVRVDFNLPLNHPVVVLVLHVVEHSCRDCESANQVVPVKADGVRIPHFTKNILTTVPLRQPSRAALIPHRIIPPFIHNAGLEVLATIILTDHIWVVLAEKVLVGQVRCRFDGDADASLILFQEASGCVRRVGCVDASDFCAHLHEHGRGDCVHAVHERRLCECTKADEGKDAHAGLDPVERKG
mmetsp:Transcript_31580/g.59314  ORF Transcript_31580/g.59314 Transcript_31580/m.59314 type:complete len:396 (+) Transcript_31580:669-1856(+)